jgi:hypothetical protein
MKIISHNLKKLMYLLAVLSLLAFSSSCSSKPENAIVGKWQEINGTKTETMEFFKNGTVRSIDKKSSLVGNFKFIDKDHIKIEVGERGASAKPLIVKVAIFNEVLTLTMPDGNDLKYYKAQ